MWTSAAPTYRAEEIELCAGGVSAVVASMRFRLGNSHTDAPTGGEIAAGYDSSPEFILPRNDLPPARTR